ncbi:sugar ABC transporter substrate-binding protein [Thermoanaerobacterium sp. PSU-2]|uniref:ABC transporter substrate-binding protein n=1 Tax=Thermoanaerobacterium sp. PSU-2 TaxID=1930849 RepID=UPI000A14AD17|nr:ABC transporter substrate-binding protein [Thermoanaerobacterium sp. PSU-2]ORX24470.1 sugar ABC transporter substrate-binding protein [Thermoanaerobacterium sp. PSU-2]HHV75262.1 ABC transporter substrate-binding protein [Thermoanaerobacterium sp.]
MKKSIFALAAFFIISFAVSGCQSKTTSTGSTGKMITIGITQIVEHPALDSAREGFIKALKDNGYEEGKNVTYIKENAQGDMSTAETIAKKFVDKNVDLIFSIATPTTQAVKKATSTIPIVFTAVTDPVAAGLVKSLDNPGGNVTGTSDMEPINDQLKLIKDLVPDAKRIGIIYNAGEVNSTVQVKIAKDDAAKLGFSVKEATVSNSSEVSQAAQSLVGKVDAIWLPTDNTVASSVAAIIKVTNSAKIPVIAAEKGMVEGGSLATLGISYSDLGYQAGLMAIKILKGEKPANIKVETAKNLQLILNQKEADAIGFKIPDSIMKKAQEVIK